MTKRGLNSNASNTTLASLLRGWKEERRGENRERGQASCTSSPTDRPLACSPARPPASSRCSDYCCWWGAKPCSSTGRGRERRLERAPVVGGRDAKRRRRDADRAGREREGRRIVDVVKLQLSYTPASSPPPSSPAFRLLPLARSHSLALHRTLGLCVSVVCNMGVGRTTDARTDRPICGPWKLFSLNDL